MTIANAINFLSSLDEHQKKHSNLKLHKPEMLPNPSHLKTFDNSSSPTPAVINLEKKVKKKPKRINIVSDP